MEPGKDREHLLALKGILFSLYVTNCVLRAVWMFGMTKYGVDHVDRVDHIITASAAPRQPYN